MRKREQVSMKSLTLIGMLAVCFCAAAIYLFLNTSSALTMKDSGFQVGAGEKLSLSKGTKLIVEELGTTFRGAATNQYLTSSPIYYDHEESILLPQDMIYVDARKATYAKAERFAKLTMDGNEVNYEDTRLNKGVLFDGFNTYVALEESVFSINGKTQTIGALSSIVLYAHGSYTLYDTKTKKISIGTLYQDHAELMVKDYHIDIVSDILYKGNEEKILLFNRSDVLDPIE